MKNGMKLSLSMVGICASCLMTLICVSNIAAQETATEAAAPENDDLLSMKIDDRFFIPPSDSVDRKDSAAIAQWRVIQKRVNKLRRDTRSAVSDLMKGKATQINSTDVDAWINGYVIPSMAQKDEKTLSKLGDERKNFFRFYVTFASNNSARNQIIALTIPKMKEIVEGNYHPACRVNAMVLLSELNDREGSRNDGRLPTPNASILAYMRDAVNQDILPSYLKVPAMAGIKRHAACRVPGSAGAFPEQEARNLASEMMTVLNLDPDVAGVETDQVRWMKRLAIQSMGYIGRPGESGSVASALRGIILDDDQEMRMRHDAIVAYGLIDFGNEKESAEVMKVALKIGELIAESALAESEYIDKTINDIKMTVRFLDGGDASSQDGGGKRSRGSVGLGQGADGGPGGGNAPKAGDIVEVLPAYQRDLVRRRIQNTIWAGRYTLVGSSRDNVTGLKDLVEPDSEEAKLIDQLRKDVDALLVSSNIKPPKVDEEDDNKRSRDDRKDRKKKKDDTEEEVKKSLADQMKDALAAGAEKIQLTVDKFSPKDEAATEDSSGAAGAETAAGAGQ